jgi:translation initiation factor IF-2
MPAKPKSPSPKSDTSAVSSKKAAPLSKKSINESDADELEAVQAKGKGTKKKPTLTELRERSETLDLLEEKSKPKRGAAASAADVGMSTIGARPKPAPAASGVADASSAEARPSKLDEQKQNALSLFDPEAMKAERIRQRDARRKEVEESKALPAISRLIQEKDERQEAEKAALTAILQKSTAPASADTPEHSAPVEEVVKTEAEEADSKIIHIKPPIIVRELAERMGLKGFKLVADLMAMDIFVNQNQAIEPDVAAKVAEKHGFIFEREKREKGAGVHKEEKVVVEPLPPVEEKKEEMVSRPPIITVMGHVDHGKTSLLDAIRKTRVTAGEAGGITQHIGAYNIEHNGQKVTFLDTPGHAAFTAMRARGAGLTDIVILVVAADDGLMPQTLESISHAKAAGVTIVVAMNKMDLPAANPDRLMAQLQEQGLAPTAWGGNTEVVPVSALKGTGVDALLETALLEAEVMELKANPEAPCRAIIVESRVEPGKGPSATIIPRSGTLKVGASFICGPFYGKVKSMLNDVGKAVQEAGPAIPVEVIGFSALPNVGDELVVMDDKEAKRLSEQRVSEQRLEKLGTPRRTTLETLFRQMEAGEKKNLRIILKSDVQGSLEAISGQLKDIKSEKIDLDIIHQAVGPISENDVLLAGASDAIIVGFSTKVEGKAVKVAKSEGVQIKLFSIIYELFDQVKEAMLGMLDPISREKQLGTALVKQVFKVNKGKIGGCVVTSGRIARSARARVVRGKEKTPVYDGGFHTLRRFTEDVTEVRNGLECGIRLGDFNDYIEGDVIECYELEKIAQGL